jgi:hypothetical protein
MAFDGLRQRLRALGGSDADADRERAREAGRAASGTVRRRAPATGLEGNRTPSPREELADRLQSAGAMRKPIEDANLQPGADPRQIEAFARGDARAGAGFFDDEPRGDPYQSFFATGDDPSGTTSGPLFAELLDERDHEGGLYAYRDERETGLVDDGADLGMGLRF